MKKLKKDNSKTINIVITIGIIILIGLLIFLFIKSGQTDNRIKKINYSEYKEIIKEDKYKIILLTNPSCIHCNNYKPFANYVAIENNLDIYDINLTTLTESEYNELHDKYTAIRNDFGEGNVPIIRTPVTVITKNGGEVTSILGDIGYDGLVKLLKNNKIKKKKNHF